jgi:hypothetical protein
MSLENPPHELEQRIVAVVLLGRFNPRIFQPAWFAARELLAEVDVDPKSIVMTDGFVAFDTEFVKLLCAQDRCQFVSGATTPTPELIRDLVIGTFTILAETPIWEFGINHAVHIPPQIRRWDDVTAALGDPQRSLMLLEGQALQTVVLQSPRTDRYEGSRTLSLQPSVQLETGVYMALNDDVIVHPPDSRDAIGARRTIEILDDVWDESHTLAESIRVRLAPT